MKANKVEFEDKERNLLITIANREDNTATMDMYRVYGDKYDEDGETLDWITDLELKQNVDVDTFDEAALLMFDHLARQGERLNTVLKHIKRAVKLGEYREDEVPF